MKLSELIYRVQLHVPNIKESGISTTQIETLLNQACNQINLIAKVYKGLTGGYTDFNIVANQQFYSLASNVTTYLGMAKEGMYFYTSDSEWKKVYPKTKAWLDKSFPNWLNADAVEIPQYYAIEGDELFLYPKCEDSRTNGARLFHLKMTI